MFDRRSLVRKTRGVRRATVKLLQDRPFLVSLAIACTVGLHSAVSSLWLTSLNPYKSLPESANSSTSVTLYLGAAAASAIVAGFAGVVIVFTVGSASPRVRMFRYQAGRQLRANWLVVIAEPLIATLLGILASIVQMTSGKPASPWLFELAMGLLIHGAARLLWVLKLLTEVVNADDVIVEREQLKPSLDEMFGEEPGQRGGPP